jgi:hypothetical protein
LNRLTDYNDIDDGIESIYMTKDENMLGEDEEEPEAQEEPEDNDSFSSPFSRISSTVYDTPFPSNPIE